MAACASCGAASPEQARYCPACGLPVSSGSQQATFFLEPAGTPAPSVEPASSTKVASASRSVKPVAAAAGVVLLVGLIWSAATPSTTGDRATNPAAAQTGADDSSDPPPRNPGPVAGPVETPETDGEAAADTPGEDTGRPAVVTDFFDGEFTSDVFANLSVVGPLLENEEVGYRLVASSRTQLFDINLDTGELTRHPMAVQLVGVLGEELIVFDPDRGFVAVPVNDLNAPGRLVFTVPEVTDGDRAVSVDNLLAATVRPPNTLLAEFLRPAPAPAAGRSGTDQAQEQARSYGTQLYEVDIANGRFAATTIAVDPRPGTPDRTRHGLAALDSGGLFEAAGNSYRKLADGQALLLGVNHAVVRQCPEPGSCRILWVDRETGQEIDRPLPVLADGPQTVATDAITAITAMDAEARVVLVTGPDGSQYFDVDSGQLLTALDPLSLTVTNGPLGRTFGALSPDGRWMALPVGGSIVLYDRSSGLLYRRGSGPSAELEQFVFLPNTP